MGETTPQFVELKSPPAPYFGVTGAQAEQAKQKDKAVQRLAQYRTQPSTPEFQQLLEAFKASPATGCTTVLDQLRRLMMFYIELTQHPLFSQLPFDSFSFELKVGMGEPALNPDAIIRRYQGSDGEASRRIRQHYDVILQTALSNRGKTQEGDLLQEHSLGVRERITFLYIHTSLYANLNMLPPSMVIGVVGGARNGMEWVFDTAKWPSYAEAVLKQDLKTIDDFLSGL
jgi:hypothetical protein